MRTERMILACPICGSAKRLAVLRQVPVQVFDRSCRCDVQWRIEVRPVRKVMQGRAFAWAVEWQHAGL